MENDGLDNFRLRVFLLERSDEEALLPWSTQVEAAETFGFTLARVEECALDLGILPARYQRNRQTISVTRQLKLFRSRAVIIGCGGLGGYLIEELARLGVGRLMVVDPDIFEEHNLNRQLLSSVEGMGQAKVEAAAARVKAINPAVTVTTLQGSFSAENAREIIAGADVVLDGLDNVTTRLTLARVCRGFNVPLVHGAIAGWYGQVAIQLPGQDISPFLSGNGEGKGVETRLGNPSFTPAVVASLQVAEACKILLKEESIKGQSLLLVNLLEMEIERMEL